MFVEIKTVSELSELNKQFAAAIGFFDGVHLAHQQVIRTAVEKASEKAFKSLVVTFDRSPKADSQFLTPLTIKLQLFAELGVDYVLVLTFDEILKQLTAQDFITNYLVRLGVGFVSVGFDFKFGHLGVGNIALLQNQSTLAVAVCEPKLMDDKKVSTTRIKKSLQFGDIGAANAMLGRNFSVQGKVVYGQQLGRTIGFPTANVQLDEQQFLGLTGVYATRVTVNGQIYSAMTNIGYNPTANQQNELSVETNIFDFAADIYGERVQIEFLQKIRNEMKFAGIDELVSQLKQDQKIAENTQ